MKRPNVVFCGHQFLSCRDMAFFAGLKLRLHLGLCGLFFRQRFGVSCALLLGVSHQLLIVSLGIFLFGLGLGHLLVQIPDEGVNHGNDATTLLTLRLVGAHCGRWRRRRCIISLAVL